MNTTKSPIIISKNALQELKKLQAKESGKLLTLGVKGGGCAGFSYILEFNEITTDTSTYEIEGLKVSILPEHLLYLENMELDYETGLNSRGFIFNNPNAEKTCGCGTSFAA